MPRSYRPISETPVQVSGKGLVAALGQPGAEARLRRATAELAEVRTELAHDKARAFRMAARREQERALREEEQAISYRLTVDGVDELELASMAPSLYRERRTGRHEA